MITQHKTQTKGHNDVHRGIQNHSIGELYPCIIVGYNKGFTVRLYGYESQNKIPVKEASALAKKIKNDLDNHGYYYVMNSIKKADDWDIVKQGNDMAELTENTKEILNELVIKFSNTQKEIKKLKSMLEVVKAGNNSEAVHIKLYFEYTDSNTSVIQSEPWEAAYNRVDLDVQEQLECHIKALKEHQGFISNRLLETLKGE